MLRNVALAMLCVVLATTGCVHRQKAASHSPLKVGDRVDLRRPVVVFACEKGETTLTSFLGTPVEKNCITGGDGRSERVTEVLRPPLTLEVEKIFTECFMSACSEHVVMRVPGKWKKYMVFSGGQSFFAVSDGKPAVAPAADTEPTPRSEE